MRDYLVALYHAGNDWHSGLWSKGYRLMCLASMYCERWFDFRPTLDIELTPHQRVLYDTIVDKSGPWL